MLHSINGNMFSYFRALGSKDLGYESDSNLVIRKRAENQQETVTPPPPPLSPAEQRQVYVEVQKGGEVPLHGLRKPAPEKPKGEFLLLVHFRFVISFCKSNSAICCDAYGILQILVACGGMLSRLALFTRHDSFSLD